MSRTLTTVKAAAAIALVATNLSAQEARPRQAAEGAQAARVPSEQVSSRPYAGSWTGTFTLAGRAVPMSVRLDAIDGSLDTYAGETAVGAAAAFANVPLPLLATPAEVRTASAAPMVASASAAAPRASGGARGPALESLASLDLSSGTAILVPFGEDRPLLCDPGRRCTEMPLARWEAKGLGGAAWIYTATLVARDRIEGTIAEKEGAAGSQIATFTLTRVQ